MLAISRALLQNPELLVLDEPTEGLAPVIRQEIWAAIAKLREATGVAILLVDKSVAEISKVADRAVILERGATVWQGHMGDLTPEISGRFIGI